MTSAPTLLNSPIPERQAGEPRRFTVDELFRMAEIGIFDPLEHVELIHGEIIWGSRSGDLPPDSPYRHPAGEPRLFTVDELFRMTEAGIFGAKDRIELIKGEIVWMSPIGNPHRWIVAQLQRLIHKQLDDQFVCCIQGPLRLDAETYFEPDVVLAAESSFKEPDVSLDPADVLLLGEVSDSSLARDLHTKLPLYAAARIPEVWIINVNDESVTVFLAPEGDRYQVVQRHAKGEAITASKIPGLRIEVASIFARPRSNA